VVNIERKDDIKPESDVKMNMWLTTIVSLGYLTNPTKKHHFSWKN
jgi:hypothetical protein